ncbi:DEAD/DEAH box helicase [Candidatus Colwellia aromaticivorans]|uniref:DEAD/DEAH box helicase n=1 Tax=Candidatus Colwellia aromaticivorans TaxID=2267621 RepID=UPI000DF206CB|nr:DEAD/DEAH box helicase [Candidatus Colwellia aromaticivorans]
MKFIDIALNNKLQKALKELEYNQATQIQQQAIPLILAENDVMARAKTGTGKTAAFALPILNKLIEKKTKTQFTSALVLAPTRELVQQIYSSFITYGKYTDLKISAAFGGVSINPQIRDIKQGVDILIATPGRLLDLLSNDHLSLQNVTVLTLDEADRMLDLGFKVELDQILQYMPIKRQTLLFSATFDDAIYKWCNSLLNDAKIVTVDDKNETAENVDQIVYTVDSDRKRELLSYLIGSKNWQQVLIFTRTKIMADVLAKEMCKDGIKTQSLHGDKSQGARDKALSDFKSGKVRALVATDVAARGIDIVDLGYVINYELPYVAEDYVHRIGRTGRAGNNGLAISLLSPDEEWLLTAIEKVIDTRLLQQWLPGYEPDLTKIVKTNKSGNKQKARNKALSNNKDGKTTSNRRRGQSSNRRK